MLNGTFLKLPKELENKTFHLKNTTPTSLIKKKTNNDLFNEMTPEEKAEYMFDKCDHCAYAGCCEYGLTRHLREMCTDGLTLYLKQEVAENERET